MKKAAVLLAAAAFSAGGLTLALSGIDWTQVRAAWGRLEWRWLPLLAAAPLGDLALRAWRWRVLLDRDAPVGRLFRLEAIGLAVNNLVFMKFGELARAALAARSFSMPPASALSTVAVERALDVAALLVLFQAGAALAPGAVGPGILRAAGLGLAGLAAGLAAAAACGGALDRRLERFPRARELAGQLVSGAAALRRPGPAAAAGLLSLAVWGCDAFGFWAAAQALGLGEFVNAPRAVLALSWAAAGSALPAAPGALGTFEAFVRAALERFGAAPADALAYAVFAHATGFTVVTGLGLVFLWREGLSLAAARKTAQDAARG